MAKRAVVVGINDYSIQIPDGKHNLNYCVSDAQAMYQLLVDALGFDPSQTFYYGDADASRNNIMQALRYITSNGEAGDVACFYFSGHGARLRADPSRPDCDKFYEAIIPASGDYISDYEVRAIAEDLPQSVVNFTVILDACHSGWNHLAANGNRCRTVDFDPALIQAMVQFMKTIVPCGISLQADAPDVDGNVTNVSASDGTVHCDVSADKNLVPLAKSTLISACRYDELSWESDNVGHGFLTQSFLDIVNQSNFQIDYQTLLAQLRDKVSQRITALIATDHPGTTQTPQLMGQQNRMAEGFLQPWMQSR